MRTWNFPLLILQFAQFNARAEVPEMYCRRPEKARLFNGRVAFQYCNRKELRNWVVFFARDRRFWLVRRMRSVSAFWQEGVKLFRLSLGWAAVLRLGLVAQTGP